MDNSKDIQTIVEEAVILQQQKAQQIKDATKRIWLPLILVVVLCIATIAFVSISRATGFAFAHSNIFLYISIVLMLGLAIGVVFAIIRFTALNKLYKEYIKLTDEDK